MSSGVSDFWRVQRSDKNVQSRCGFYCRGQCPMYKGVEADATVGFTYGQFYYNGLGFRAGFQYTPSVAEVDNAFGVPVAFAYRTGTRSRRARLESGLSSAANSVFWDLYNDYDRDCPEMLCIS